MASKKNVELVLTKLKGQVKEMLNTPDEGLRTLCEKLVGFKVEGERRRMAEFVVDKLFDEAMRSIGTKAEDVVGLDQEEMIETLLRLFKETGLKIVPKGRLRNTFLKNKVGSEYQFEQTFAKAEHSGLLKLDVTSSGTIVAELKEEAL